MSAPRSVLFVDDDPDIRFIAEIALSRVGGLRTTVADSAEEARRQLAKELPDVVLLDVTMPECDGPTFLQELKSTPGMEDLRVIFITARTALDEVQGYLSLGAAGVLAKPFDPMTLSRRLGEMLGW
jgi:two-component system OmpR family response regulator